jgi:hypothetical protein
MSAVSTRPTYAFCYEEAGNRYGISPNLLYAISKGESSFNPIAINYNTSHLLTEKLNHFQISNAFATDYI